MTRQLPAGNGDGSLQGNEYAAVDLQALPVGVDPPIPPSAFRMGQAYPNPFNPRVSIPVQGLADQALTLRVFDLRGRQVDTRLEPPNTSQQQVITWEPVGVPAGIYLVQVQQAGGSQVQRVLYLP